MARFVKDGHPPVESAAPRDRVTLLAQGYRVEEVRPKAAQTPTSQAAKTTAPADKKN